MYSKYNESIKGTKGQINSVDLLIAMIVFSLALVFIIGFWFVEIDTLKSTIVRNGLEENTVAISDILIKTPGMPDNWEKNTSANISMLGLVREQNVLDKGKVNALANMSYERAKALLGIENGFYLYIQDLEGNVLYQVGNNPGNDPNISVSKLHVVSVTRYVILDNNIALLRLVLYE